MTKFKELNALLTVALGAFKPLAVEKWWRYPYYFINIEDSIQQDPNLAKDEKNDTGVTRKL